MSETVTVEQRYYTIGRGGIRLPVVDDRYKYVFHVGTFVDDIFDLNDIGSGVGNFGDQAELEVPSTDQKPLVVIRGFHNRVPDDYVRRQSCRNPSEYTRSQTDTREIFTAPEDLGSLALFLGYYGEIGWKDLHTVANQFVRFQHRNFSRHNDPDEEFIRRNPGLNYGQLHSRFIKEKVQTALQATVELLID